MPARYTILQDADGWTVIDLPMALPVIACGQEQVGLSRRVAREIATSMNRLAYNQQRRLNDGKYVNVKSGSAPAEGVQE